MNPYFTQQLTFLTVYSCMYTTLELYHCQDYSLTKPLSPYFVSLGGSSMSIFLSVQNKKRHENKNHGQLLIVKGTWKRKPS